MRLLEQPNDGVMPVIHGIESARSCLEILIFRFDQIEIERALANAVSRGVAVQALIAHVNGSGEESLRRLETRLLASGVTVSRTGGDFVRYHAKMMIVDHRELYVLGFNLTHHDINHSRSFGLLTTDAKLVREASKLFAADVRRQKYDASLSSFVVSPANAREALGSFIRGAKSELLIYDPKISDPAMVQLLEERAKAGVDIKIIGGVTARKLMPLARKLHIRLHTRTMVRDRQTIFIGSQSLRELELDGRREVGVIFRNATAVKKLVKTFHEDWDMSLPLAHAHDSAPPAVKVAKRVAKAISKELPPVAPVLEVTIKEMAGDAAASLQLDTEEVEDAVRDAVKEAVKEAVRDVVEGAAHTVEMHARPYF